MKKVFISEKNLHMLKENKEDILLSKFIFKNIKTHNTSLGDNLAFPPEEEAPFDYVIIKKRFIEVVEQIKSYPEIDSLEIDYLVSLLSKLITRCYQLEKPIRTNLIHLCENVVNTLFKIPTDTVTLKCELVSKIKPLKHSPRLTPEDSSERTFKFKNVNDYNNQVTEIMKRRLINSLIQGASYTYTNTQELYINDLNKLNDELPHLYELIKVINDYLLFVKPEEFDETNLQQGSYVEVLLGKKGEKTEINAQGLIFPFLLNEVIRGFFELFASHGLPKDKTKLEYLLKQADYMTAEPWDLRFGVILWRLVSAKINDAQLLPYFFKHICEKSVGEFNIDMKEVFAQTQMGENLLSDWSYEAQKEHDYNQFVDSLQLKNTQYTVITDDITNSEELNGEIIKEKKYNNE